MNWVLFYCLLATVPVEKPPRHDWQCRMTIAGDGKVDRRMVEGKHVPEKHYWAVVRFGPDGEVVSIDSSHPNHPDLAEYRKGAKVIPAGSNPQQKGRGGVK